MKRIRNKVLYTIGFVVICVITFSAFKDEQTGTEAQLKSIQKAVEENLAIFAEEKDEECRERALRVAQLQVDSIGNQEVSKSTVSPKPKPRPKPKPKPAETVTPKPVTPVTTPETEAPVTENPPPPPPPEPPKEEPIKDDKGNVEGATNTGKKDKVPSKDDLNKGVKNVGKKKSGN